MSDHDDRAAPVGQLAQFLHDLLVQGRVEAGRGLVEEQQGRLGEQFQGDRDTLALPAGQRVDALLGPLGEIERVEDLRDPLAAFLARYVVGEPQRGGETQRPPDGELAVQDVVLRHEADAVAQFGVVGVQVAPVVVHRALVRRAQPGHRAQQRRLAAAGRADHGEQAAFRQGEADVVDEPLLLHHDGQVVSDERDRTGVLELVQPPAVEEELVPPDRDHVAGAQRRPAHLLSIVERAVAAAEVHDLVALGGPAQFGVVAGRTQVGQDDVVVRSPPDAHPPAAGVMLGGRDPGGIRGRDRVHRRDRGVRAMPRWVARRGHGSHRGHNSGGIVAIGPP